MARERKYKRGAKSVVPISAGRGKKAAVEPDKPALDITILSERPAVPPTITTDRQRAVWDATCDALIERQLLTITDLAVLETYVVCHAAYLKLRELVMAEGDVIHNSFGSPMLNPARAAMTQEFNASLRLSKELGLTPRSRVTLELARLKARNAAMMARAGGDDDDGIDGHLGAF